MRGRAFWTAAAITAVSCWPPAAALSENPAPRPAALGALLPLSGGSADQGGYSRRGLELAAARLEREGSPVRLVFEDTKGDARAAVDAYKSLRLRFSVPLVFTWGSGVGLALLPLANHDRVIQFGVATGTPLYRAKDDFNFRNFHSLALEGKFLAAQAYRELDWKSCAILKINNDYGVASAEEFRKSYTELGGVVVYEEVLDLQSGDYRALASQLKHRAPELIFMAAYPAEGALMLKQARAAGVSAAFLASGAILGDKGFFSVAEAAAEGLLVSAPAPSDTPVFKQFAAAYEQRYGSRLEMYNWYAAYAYDALLIAARALGECRGQAPECLKERLAAVRDFPGASGRVSFDEYGDIQSSFVLLRAAGGKFVPR